MNINGSFVTPYFASTLHISHIIFSFQATMAAVIIWALAFMASSKVVQNVHQAGILYPRESETRQLKSLDGIWNFVLSPISDPLIGFNHKWYKNPLQKVTF